MRWNFEGRRPHSSAPFLLRPKTPRTTADKLFLGLKPQAESYYPFGISPTMPVEQRPDGDAGLRSVDRHNLEHSRPVRRINGNAFVRPMYLEIDGTLANSESADANLLKRFG
jgi:hypothetical protein